VSATEPAPIVLKPGEGEAFWFFGGLVTIKAAEGSCTVSEYLMPRGAGTPLHVHHREDEWFYVLEGEVTFWVGGQSTDAVPGSFVYGPRDVPHTFMVVSDEARFLLVTEPGGFDGFIRALGEPATTLTIPPAPEGPPDMEPILRAAAEHGMEILGPPGIPA
jgi:quercetin dioxygenase-like cupin family protein